MEEVVKTGSLLVYDPNRLSATAELRFFFYDRTENGKPKKEEEKKNEPGFRLGHFLFVRRQRGRTGGEFDIVLDGGIAIIR